MERWVGEGTEDGQATLEVALVLPLIMMLLMLTAQVGAVVRNEVLVIHAAREAARAAAVAEDDLTAAARIAAEAAGPLSPRRLDVTVDVSTADRVRVEVTYDDPTDIPLIGRIIPSVRHRVNATMQRESQEVPR